MWTYEQDTGCMFAPDGEKLAHGYAGGNCGRNPEAINNHAMQSAHNTGPLPCGVYHMGDVLEQSKLGPFAIPLTPDPSNEMFGRGHFFVHGDTVAPGAASEGCIIMPRAARLTLAASTDKELHVMTKEDHDGLS